jgi:hypothetical protein
LDTVSDETTPGAPVGSIYLPAGDSADVLVTALIGEDPAGVNTSGQGWGVKSSTGGGNPAQTVDSGESIMIRFYQNNSLGGESLPGEDKLGGVQDFRFVPSGFTGGMQTASLFVTVVVVNESGESQTCDFALSDLLEDIPVVLSDYLDQIDFGFVDGYLIQSVVILNDASSGGLRIDQPAYPEYLGDVPPALEASFTLSIADRDGDFVSTDFQLSVAGEVGDDLDVVVIPDSSAQVPEGSVAIAPIVVDLDGDGFGFLSREAGVQFDYTGSGERQATAWAGAADGLLAYDLNQDGAITLSREFVFTQWAPQASTDLEALALAFDSNGDGLLSSLDSEWGKFGLWSDANSNGISDQGEFLSLDDLGIASISLGYQVGSSSVVGADGDVIVAGTSLVTWDDGRVTQAADASFMADAPVMSDGPSQKDPLTGIPEDGSVPMVNPDGWGFSLPGLLGDCDSSPVSLQDMLSSLPFDADWLAILGDQWCLGSCDATGLMVEAPPELLSMTCFTSGDGSRVIHDEMSLIP